MKTQMSLEMLTYVSIAGISILYSIGAISSYYSRVNQSLGYYGYSNFVEAVNTAILDNYGSVSLYIPQGMCGLQVNGSDLNTKYGVFYFVQDVRMSKNLTCRPGAQYVDIYYGQDHVTVV